MKLFFIIYCLSNSKIPVVCFPCVLCVHLSGFVLVFKILNICSWSRKWCLGVAILFAKNKIIETNAGSFSHNLITWERLMSSDELERIIKSSRIRYKNNILLDLLITLWIDYFSLYIDKTIKDDKSQVIQVMYDNHNVIYHHKQGISILQL